MSSQILKEMAKFHLVLKTGQQMTKKALISRKAKAFIHRISLLSIYLNMQLREHEAKRLYKKGKRV